MLITTIDGVRKALSDAAALAAGAGEGAPRVALVPTMGALHTGHLRLIERAREVADIVVVSIFVNPLQFGQGEDLDAYPRTLDEDRARITASDVASQSIDTLVFAPSVGEMYPGGALDTRVVAGPAGARFEGSSRPGHFDGMLTVVNKLLNIVRPDAALFGEKDRQQLALIRQMVRDFDIATEVVPVPTVRDVDGLALSSRNRFLSAEERASALALSRGLRAAADLAASETGSSAAAATRPTAAILEAAARAVLDAEPGVIVDYLAVVDPVSFEPVQPDHVGEAAVIVAARVGSTRLIDNLTIQLG